MSPVSVVEQAIATIRRWREMAQLPPKKLFQRWLNANADDACALLATIYQKKQNMTALEARAKALAFVAENSDEKNAAYAWRLFISDAKIVELLLAVDTPDSKFLARAIQKQNLASCVKTARQRTIALTETHLVEHATSALQPRKIPTETRDVLGYLAAFTQSQSNPDAYVHSQFLEVLAYSTHMALSNARTMRGAGALRCLSVDGSATYVGDATRDLTAKDVSEYLLAWRSVEWGQKPSAEDVRARIAQKYEELQAQNLQRADAALAESSVAETIDPTSSIVLHNIIEMAQNEWFLAASDEAHARKRKSTYSSSSRLSAKKVCTASERANRLLPTLDAAYLKDFWREPTGSERACFSDSSCYCMAAASSQPHLDERRRTNVGFICRELLMPNELNVFCDTGKLPAARAMCFFCELYVIETQHEMLMKRNERGLRTLNRFKMQVGVGGFDQRCMLPQEIGGQKTGIVGHVLRLQVQDFGYAVVTREGTGEEVSCMYARSQLDFRLPSPKQTVT